MTALPAWVLPRTYLGELWTIRSWLLTRDH